MKTIYTLFLAALVASFLIGCGGSPDPTEPNPNNTNTITCPAGEMLQNSACVPNQMVTDACAGVVCQNGQTCSNGTCVGEMPMTDPCERYMALEEVVYSCDARWTSISLSIADKECKASTDPFVFTAMIHEVPAEGPLPMPTTTTAWLFPQRPDMGSFIVNYNVNGSTGTIQCSK